MPPPLATDQQKRLLAAAREAIGRAYAPYSKFHVGAAVLTGSGNIYTGSNVENASYGLTICAERAAIFTAVSAESASVKIAAVAVCIEPQGASCAPCGACRQVIFEFGDDVHVLFYAGGRLKSVSAAELLPYGFRLSSG